MADYNGILQALMQQPPQQSGGILGDNWSRLVEAGGTQQPPRVSTGMWDGLTKLIMAANGGKPVTTDDLVRLSTMELGQPTQGLRDLMNMFVGKPRQTPGRLIEQDPYNPFQGGT